MANAVMTDFLVDLLMSDQKLTDFQDYEKRKAMVETFVPVLEKDDADALRDRMAQPLRDRIRAQQGGTGQSRVKEANRLAAKARKAAPRKAKKAAKKAKKAAPKKGKKR